MSLSACPDCGSQRLRAPTVGDGLAAGGGEGLLQVCGECGYRGAPLVFEDRPSYAAFQEAKRADPPGPREPWGRGSGPSNGPEVESAPHRARPDERDAFDRLRMMPIMALAIGAALAGYGLLGFLGTLTAVAITGQLLGLVGAFWPFISVFIGLAFFNVGLRAWRKA